MDIIWYWSHPRKKYHNAESTETGVSLGSMFLLVHFEVILSGSSQFVLGGEVSPWKRWAKKKPLRASKNVGTSIKQGVFLCPCAARAREQGAAGGWLLEGLLVFQKVEEVGWYPPLKNRQHQDESFFSRDPYWPSLSTVAWRDITVRECSSV